MGPVVLLPPPSVPGLECYSRTKISFSFIVEVTSVICVFHGRRASPPAPALIATCRGDEVEPFILKDNISLCWAACCAFNDFTSRKRTGNLVMEILGTYLETTGWFPKEITKTREETGRHFSVLSHLLGSFCSQGRNKRGVSSFRATICLGDPGT